MESTNIFEIKTGVMNIAPIKISGQYKIIVAIDGKLWLDDYTNRRVLIDTSIAFLPQVSNFLTTKTIIPSTTQLRYGGFQRVKTKAWHIPFYLGSSTEYPNFFSISNVINDTITSIDYLYKYAEIFKIVDLEKIGLHNIFDEIMTESYFEYPLYFNWEDYNIKMYGYSIDKNIPAVFTYDLLKSSANQSYFPVLNNKILNTFQQQGMFFPKFINIEFEFEYSNNYVAFNNFYGYLSTKKETVSPLNEKHNNIILADYSNKIDWRLVSNSNKFVLNKFNDISATGTIQEVKSKPTQYRFKINRLNVNDEITIRDSNGEIDFQYIVKNNDIDFNSLYTTVVNICKKANKECYHNFEFTPNIISENFVAITIVSNIGSFYDDENYTVELPIYYHVLDRFSNSTNFNKFRGIIQNDIWLCGQPNLLENINIIEINNEYYEIYESFKFNDSTIIRLNKNPNITGLTNCTIYENKQEQLIELIPLNFLNINTELKSELPYDFKKYVKELHTNFNSNPIARFNINEFAKHTSETIYQYVEDNLLTKQLEDIPAIITPNHNTEIIKNMLFCSMGSTSYLTPNILNIDKNFYVQNGNLDTNIMDKDMLRFNWFLLKGKCPEYLKNDIRSYRYFNTIPKITSRLIKINGEYCETIFLGIKYQLPIKYENYQFATYLNFNNQADQKINYAFEVDHSLETVYLTINKYLDFLDLIRGANINNEPLLDLSFFYNVTSMHNGTSNYLDSFKSGGVKLCYKGESENDYILFNDKKVYDWKYELTDLAGNKNWYIALKRDLTFSNGETNNFTTLFGLSEDAEIYVYNDIMYDGELYTYISMTINIIKIKILKDDYLWCEDIKVKFFDTPKIFLKKYNPLTNEEEISYIDRAVNIISSVNKNTNIFGDHVKVATVNVGGVEDTFEILLSDKQISLKEYYFEINQIVTESNIGVKTIDKKVFKFPEFFNTELTDTDIITQFDTDSEIVFDYQINLFDRNQIWNLIKDVFALDLKFKSLSKGRVILKINELMVTALQKTSLPIKNLNNEFINFKIIDNDRNIAIWDIFNKPVLTMLNRYRAPYIPYFEIFKNEINFQLTQFQKTNTFFNIYDKDFAGPEISATGLWEEVQGNIVSSLFCKSDNIIITTTSKESIDYKKLLMQSLDIHDCICTSKNTEYISKINSNIDEYIIEKYVSMLLLNFYNFDHVQNEFGQRISYFNDIKNTTLIHFRNSIVYNTLVFVFTRK